MGGDLKENTIEIALAFHAFVGENFSRVGDLSDTLDDYVIRVSSLEEN
jgi:hypothetical protein